VNTKIYNFQNYVNESYLVRESEYNLLLEELASTLMKLFGAQTAKKLERIFADKIDNIESFFAQITSATEKVLITKSGQQYLRSSIGVEIPTSTIKSILDLALAGKITKSNMDEYLNLLPEKFHNGSNFRGNIEKLLDGIITRLENGGGKIATKTANKTSTKPVASTAGAIGTGSFKMAGGDESFKLAGWLDQKFYESKGKRHSVITDDIFNKMLPETKEYLKILYKRMKEILPDNPNSREIVKTDRDVVDAVTNNYWGGFNRPNEIIKKYMNERGKTTAFPIPSKSVEDNLNSIFPTDGNSMYANGKNFWSSTK